MLALATYRSTLCPLCGRPLDVCTDPRNERNWRSVPPTRCHATTAVIAAQKAATIGGSETRLPGALLWHAELKT